MTDIELFKEYERRIRIKVNNLVNYQNYETEEVFLKALDELLAFVNADIEKLLEIEEETITL